MDKLFIDTFSFYEQAFVVERLTPRTPIWMACENIRFSSLFVAGDVSTKSEEKRMFSQATIKRSGVQALPSAFFFAQETLFHVISVHPSVYLATGDILLGDNPAMD